MKILQDAIDDIYAFVMGPADLNLTRTFVAIYETRSVTAAAQRLQLSQPTVTHALNRLRRQMGDELFLRERRGVTPTARARYAYPALVEALNAIDSAFEGQDEFDPTSEGTTFHLALSDAGEATLLPRMWGAIHALSPASNLAIHPLDVDQVEDQVLRGELDGFVSGAHFDSRRLARRDLLQEHYVVLLSDRHPRLRDSVSSDQLEFEQHVVVNGAIGHQEPPRLQREHGVRVAVEVPRYSALPNLLRNSDAVAIAPQYVAETFAANGGLRHLPLPWPIKGVRLAAWSRHAHACSPQQRWVLDTVAEAISGIADLDT
ncbi:LysR family transcriptional regulator [Luteococcus sp. OSA5]|uniref:LysR family transcriptional regulator n=1 Tax=Luteococcus sp. OSA5 TaxID=3401630 RepID=UPI003B430A5A